MMFNEKQKKPNLHQMGREFKPDNYANKDTQEFRNPTQNDGEFANNKYYVWWKINKPLLSLFPALVFWIVSMVFFVVGLRFKNPIIVFGADVSAAIAMALSISNTIIQIIGNEQERDGLGLALYSGWIASYVLGIGTNIIGLMTILSIDNVYLEWAVAIGLGTMIDVLPEKLLVQFLRGFKSVYRRANGSTRGYSLQEGIRERLGK